MDNTRTGLTLRHTRTQSCDLATSKSSDGLASATPSPARTPISTAAHPLLASDALYTTYSASRYHQADDNRPAFPERARLHNSSSSSSSSSYQASGSYNQRQPGHAVALSPALGLPQQLYTKAALDGSTPSSPATARSSPRLPPSTLKASVSEAGDSALTGSPAWGGGGMAGQAASGVGSQTSSPQAITSAAGAMDSLHGIVEARNWVALDVEDSRRPRGAPSSSSAHGWRKAPVARPSRSGAYISAESDAVMCCLQLEWVKALVDRSERHPWACLALAVCVLLLLVFLCSL